jgi:diguanylate cyclase (GGDEF)-like protein
MEEVSAEIPMELLLSDSSRAHLEQVAVNPVAGAPSCPVESPFSCVAVRRGNPVVFESSTALNACPKLRDRPGGACSAVCVPISFMGRSLGVLHATGPDGSPPDEEQAERLATLAAQAGARIGTVRAFARTQLQASTDGLTGLINRRTLETQVRSMMRQRTPFALAIADLDHFKQLNDTHGHEAGDRSLRTFAQSTLQVLREVDLVARWGGEEFVIVMPGADTEQAVVVLERVRANLANVVQGQVPFTASFGVTDSTKAATLQELIQLGDLALYAAKNGGRDRISVADERSLTLVDGAAARNGLPRLGGLLQHATDDDPHVGGLEVI